MDAPLDLADIRREIDAVDAELRALLLRRADLVAHVAASKAQDDEAPVIRPEREAAQMLDLLAWQKDKAPHLSRHGVLAVWREIIGLAIAQQGGMDIFVTASSQAVARAYFGASLTYHICEDAAAVLHAATQSKNAIGILMIEDAMVPTQGQCVFARLPIEGEAVSLCYGSADLILQNASHALVSRRSAEPGDKVLKKMSDAVLVETKEPGEAVLWGRFMVAGENT